MDSYTIGKDIQRIEQRLASLENYVVALEKRIFAEAKDDEQSTDA